MDEYYIWAGPEKGYLSKGGGFSTDRRSAERFSHADALLRCKRMVDHEGEPKAVPVSKAMLEELK